MMRKERELLKECRLILDTPFNGSTGINLRNRIAELLTQPEQNNTQYLLEQVSRLTAENAMLKEKWSTPKREPLSDKDIGKGFLLTDVWHRYECFIAGIKWAERQHGITGGEE